MDELSTEDHPDWWRPMGGQNSQDSTLERRSLVWNDNNVVAPDAPPSFYTCKQFTGKFYTRGCRGKIEEIQIYCQNAGVDFIVLRYSPFPGIGPFGEVTITPGATWAWAGAIIEEMWNYDSLFIWVHFCQAGTDWAYDTEQPHDGHVSTSAEATWADLPIRPFIRVVYTGETPGDVPVSGTINVIDIPSVATRATPSLGQQVQHNIYAGGLAIEVGAGTLLEARAVFYTSVAPTAGDPPAAVYYEMTVFVDGAATLNISNRDLTQSAVATSGRNSVGEFYQITVADPVYDRTVMILRMPIKFQRVIAISLYQSTGGLVDVDVYVYANMLK